MKAPIPLPREDTTGLKSINKRLSELEQDLEHDKEMSFLTRLKNADKLKKKEELEKLYGSFAESLAESDISINSCNLVSVIIHTIKYVNHNVVNISRLAGSKPSQEFERICVCNFLADMLIEEWTEDLVKCSVDVLYPIVLFETPKIEHMALALVNPRKSKFKLGKFF